jgi:hypothetical protein
MVTMTPQMEQALVRLSTFHDPEPTIVFRHLLTALSRLYDGTMAMINVRAGNQMVFREVVNPSPALAGVPGIALYHSY